MADLPLILNAIASTFGIRTEKEPAHEVLATLAEGIEVRRYPERRAYQVRQSGTDMEGAFGRLFQAISGANTGRAKIPMTAPVEQGAGQAIPMTAPAEQAAEENGRVMRFFLPDDLTDPPAPTEPEVELVTLPAQTLGVRRFSGTWTPENLNAAEATLRDALRVAGWVPDGPRLDWLYDPPFSLPPLRRNEVALAVTPA